MERENTFKIFDSFYCFGEISVPKENLCLTSHYSFKLLEEIHEKAFFCCWLAACRDSGNDFGHFSVPFFSGRISDIRAACNYPTRNANFKSWFLYIRIKSVLFLGSHYLSTQEP